MGEREEAAVEPARFVHQEDGRSTVVVATEHGVEIHTRVGEITLTYSELDWLAFVGAPAAVDAYRRAAPAKRSEIA